MLKQGSTAAVSFVSSIFLLRAPKTSLCYTCVSQCVRIALNRTPIRIFYDPQRTCPLNPFNASAADAPPAKFDVTFVNDKMSDDDDFIIIITDADAPLG